MNSQTTFVTSAISPTALLSRELPATNSAKPAAFRLTRPKALMSTPQEPAASRPENPPYRRVTFPPSPFPPLFDVLLVSDPESIRRLSRSSAITRLHAKPTSDIPWHVRFALQTTMWFNPEEDAWFLGMEAKDSSRHPIGEEQDNKYWERSQYIIERLDEGYKKEEVEEMVRLLKSGEEDKMTKRALEIVNGRFYKEDMRDVPQDVVEYSGETIASLPDVLNPARYLEGRNANKGAINWLKRAISKTASLPDSAHNLHVTTRGFTRLFKSYVGGESQEATSPKDLITSNPGVPFAVRLAAEETRLEDQLPTPLEKPLIPYKTAVILNIGEAAKKTGDDLFAFGGGVEDRQCPFKKFFYSFLNEAKEKVDQGERAEEKQLGEVAARKE